MSSAAPEKRLLRLGVMPLADAASLVAAEALGLFAEAGLEVELVHEKSWAAIRDKVAIGLLDAAHMPAPMPLAATLGIDGMSVPMLTALSLNLNGNGITLSRALHAQMVAQGGAMADVRRSAQALRTVIARRGPAAPPLRLVCVHAFAKHHYELRLWLAQGGIDPERDVRLGVMPPGRMVRALESGEIDGFCAGAPWGEVASGQGVGETVVRSWDLWNNGAEKVLGTTRDWAERHPATHRALIGAVLRAARWLDESAAHREQAAQWMVERGLLAAPIEAVRQALRIDPARPLLEGGGLVFHAGAAGFPWRSHAHWFVQQMRACGQLRDGADIGAAVVETYRADLHREIAGALGELSPVHDEKVEGAHRSTWETPAHGGVLTMGPDALIAPPG